MAIQTVGVVGCGLMGSGIAQIADEAGCTVVVREVNDAQLAKGRGMLEGFLKKTVERANTDKKFPGFLKPFAEAGKVPDDYIATTLSRISWTTDLAALAKCDLVVEAI